MPRNTHTLLVKLLLQLQALVVGLDRTDGSHYGRDPVPYVKPGLALASRESRHRNSGKEISRTTRCL